MQENEEQVSNEVAQNIEEAINWEEKYNEINDKYLRAAAEFENAKRRVEKEKQSAIDYASEKFAKDMLGVVDALDMALHHADADASKVIEGISLTRDNLLKIFERHNIFQVSNDEGFDPTKHEAVMQQPSDAHADNAIISVLQKGFLLKDRLLRPSLVNVCKK
ncbi:MAG: DnaK system nucleotide exchange factor GrpE [Pseudomonadota bacterium]|jgi:molecular chaperone GrpE